MKKEFAPGTLVKMTTTGSFVFAYCVQNSSEPTVFASDTICVFLSFFTMNYAFVMTSKGIVEIHYDNLEAI